MNDLNDQAEKILKEESILKQYLESLPTNQVEKMLELCHFERVLLMMQYTSKIEILKNILKKRNEV